MSSNNDRDRNRVRGMCAAMLRRRELLKLGVAAGVGASVVALPFLRRANAMVRPDAPAKRVLVLYFAGGIRSSTAFHAAPGTLRYNPWGVIEGTNTPFALGKLLDDFLPAGTPIATPQTALPDAAYQLGAMGGWSGAQVSRLREIAANFSVVGTWNPERGDHYRSGVEEPTGSSTGSEPGLLTRIGAGFAASSGAATDVPPFHIEPNAAFGNATEDLVRFIPVPLFGSSSLPSNADLTDQENGQIGEDFAYDDGMRQRLDDRRFNASVGYGHSVIEVYRGDRQARRRIGEQLSAPWVDVNSNDDQAQGTVHTDAGDVPLTNKMLYELFGMACGPDPNGDGVMPYQNPSQSDFFGNAMDVALALRLLQLGSPATVVEMGGFDTHSGERQDAPRRFRFIGRLWSTLHWLLSRIPEPGEPGKSMLDRTLVFTMSEFGRDPGQDSTGFNNGDGSDHGSNPSCFYLAHAVMGGGIVPARHIGPAPTTTYMPATADKISPRSLLSTALWALGLDSQNPDWGFDDVSPLTQLWTP